MHINISLDELNAKSTFIGTIASQWGHVVIILTANYVKSLVKKRHVQKSLIKLSH
jgi:hypothetical protein